MNKISEGTAKSVLVDYKRLAAVKPSEKVAPPIDDSVRLLNNIKPDYNKDLYPRAAVYAFEASPMVATPIYDSVELLNNIKPDYNKDLYPRAAVYAFEASPMVATPICDFGSPLDMVEFDYLSSVCLSAVRPNQLIASPMESGKKTSR